MTKAKQEFKPGDRVAERPKSTIIPNLRAESRAIAAQYSSQRYGTVVETFVKVTKNRNNKETKLKYVRILWDGHQTPSDHAQMRICHEALLNQVINEYHAVIE